MWSLARETAWGELWGVSAAVDCTLNPLGVLVPATAVAGLGGGGGRSGWVCGC